jgi:hypothetical protein
METHYELSEKRAITGGAIFRDNLSILSRQPYCPLSATSYQPSKTCPKQRRKDANIDVPSLTPTESISAHRNTINQAKYGPALSLTIASRKPALLETKQKR